MTYNRAAKAQMDIQSEDLFDLFEADTEEKHKEIFERIFEIETYPNADFGSACNGEDGGIYFCMYSGEMIYLLLQPSECQTEALGIEECMYAVYRDSYEKEGPYIGTADPVNEIKTFSTWHEAKAEFIAQIKEN